MTTPSVTGTPQGFAFTATGTLVTYTGGGTTGATVVDVLCVNSDNTVTTPAGWTLAASRVVNQGSYVFVKTGGTTSATIDLGGGISTNTSVLWVRIKDTDGLDAPSVAAAGVDASPGSSTPALTSGALASTDLALAFGALHALGGGTPTGVTWSSGYTPQTSATIGGATSGVYGTAAVKVPAGTAAETPSVSWTNTASNRYILFVAFLASSAGAVVPSGVAIALATGTPSVTYALTAGPDGVALAVTPGSPSVVIRAPSAGDGWNTYGQILRSNIDEFIQETTTQPVICPRHDWPLDVNPVTPDVLHCPFGGELYDLRGRPVYTLPMRSDDTLWK